MKKLLLITFIALLFTANLSYVVFAADDENPPQLNIDVPPSLDIDIPEDEGTDENPPAIDVNIPEGVRITSHSANPKDFNPVTVSDTVITYSISGKAEMKVKIVDENENTVVVLVDDKDQDEGSHTTKWYGTVDNRTSGEVVDQGEYQYEIVAKDQETHEIEDIEEGEINIVYSAQTTLPRTTGQQGSGLNNRETLATMTIQNSDTGETSRTGPGILIYMIFPIVGYLISRKYGGIK